MRAKEFSRNRTLEKCISLFWENGFGATGVNDIVKRTGVNRFSLYEEFGNKEGLLLATLDLYIERYALPRLRPLANVEHLQTGLLTFYTSFFKPPAGHQKGCFIVAMALELGNVQPEVAAKLDEYLGCLKDEFLSLLKRFTIGSETEDECDVLIEQLQGLYCSGAGIGIILTSSEVEHYFAGALRVLLSNWKQNA